MGSEFYFFSATSLTVSKLDPAVIGSIRKICEMLPSSSPIILYHHILTLSRPQKNSENALRTSWHPGYGEKYFDCVALLIWPTQVSNIFSVVRWAANIQKMDYRRGRQLGLMLKNWQEHSRVSDNACQAIP